MKRYDGLYRLDRLTALMSEARVSRRRRRRQGVSRLNTPQDLARQRRAETLVERMLSGPLPERVDCSSYFNRLATRRQVASRSIGTMMTCVQGVVLSAVRARALAVAIAELIHFLETAAVGEPVRMYLAVALDGERLIVGLAAEGELALVATGEAHRSLVRARSIVTTLRGDFQRGMDGPRMVFGVTFPSSFAELRS